MGRSPWPSPRARLASAGGSAIEPEPRSEPSQSILDAAKETIDDQRWIWQHMFADLNVGKATLVPWAETTSVGGKVGQSHHAGDV